MAKTGSKKRKAEATKEETVGATGKVYVTVKDLEDGGPPLVETARMEFTGAQSMALFRACLLARCIDNLLTLEVDPGEYDSLLHHLRVDLADEMMKVIPKP